MFFGIHNHTAQGSNLRLRDSTNRIDELIDYAHELGHMGLCITDHESITAHLDALKHYESRKDEPGWENFKLGLGNEIYLCSSSVTAENVGNNVYPHFILVALNAHGHKGIRELSTNSWTQNSFMHMMYRVPTYYDDLVVMMEEYKGDVIGSSACFMKGTKVRTRYKWKSIEEIQPGDEVFNRYGKWEEVIAPTSRYYNGIGYKFTFYGGISPISCTEDHQFLTYTLNSKKLKWVAAKNMWTKSDSSKEICLLPINNFDYDHNSVYIDPEEEEFLDVLFPYDIYSNRREYLPDIIEITPEIMRLFGLFLGDGSISLRRNPRIFFSFNIKEFDIYYNSFVKKAGEQLGIKWSISRRPHENRVEISNSSRELIELFYYLFENCNAETKRIPYRLRISKELDYELLFGYLLADGYFRVKNNKSFGKNNYSGEVLSVSISPQLTRDFYELMNDLGLAPTVYSHDEHIDKNGVHHKKAWYISCTNLILGKINKLKEYTHQEIVDIFTKAFSQKKYITFDNITYRKMHIKKKEEILINEKVYCLNNSTHSFRCEDVIVHNCIGGTIPRKILQYTSPDCINREEIKQSCVRWIETMNEIFGNGYFFLELQPSFNEEQIRVNKELIELSKITGTPYIITTDSHYLKKSDREIHKAYLNSQDGDREVDEFYSSTYVMSEEEIHSYMDEGLGIEAVQSGLDNTKLIYDKIEYYRLTKNLEIPYIPLNRDEPDEKLFKKYSPKIELLEHFKNSKYDSDRHLVREIVKYIDTDPYYQTDEGYFKINECLDYVKQSSDKMKVRWSAYLLQVADYVKIAWDCGTIVGAGRGSGVGFCLLHILGITQINPLREKTQTFPWRFMNPERASVLDIDLDIMSCMRDKVIQGLKNVYGEDRVSKVMTLSTEKSKSAILTAARGLGIDNDTASYIASLVVFDRGQPRTLKQMYYGDDEHRPVGDFVREMDEHPDLWETAQRIEGLVCGVGSHAGGVIIVDKPFTESTALMRTKSGDIITQFDLRGDEDVSLIKIDLLSISLDKIYETLMLLLENGKIQWQGTLKDTYEKYIGVYTLERDALDMWQMVWNHKVLSLFQMEKESGKQALALSKPTSVDDLATINSVIRLMPQEGEKETPLLKYARFHENINLWYQEMTDYGLTEEEQDILKKIIGTSYGICEAQEYLVLLTMHPAIGGFSLSWCDKLRKSVAKKKPKEFMQLEKEFFQNAKEKHLSENLVNYVWYKLIYTQRGYGFNKSHTLAYSIIGLQELNLCYKYNPIYWQTANLIVDSGSLDEESNDSTNYGKMAVAIALIQKEGVSLYPPVVETADFGFTPNEEHNDIVFGFKAINGVNTEVSQLIINNRPYSSLNEFCEKLVDTKLIKPATMMKLIKAGCFTHLHSSDKRETMRWFLERYKFEPCKKLGLSQLNKMVDLDIIPDDFKLSVRMIVFKKYVLDELFLFKKHIEPNKIVPKRGYHDGWYKLEPDAQEFFTAHFGEDSIVDLQGESYIISEKKFTKEINQKIEPLKEWLSKEETLELYSSALFQSIWNEYASGTQAAWSMEALCYYDGEHELEHVDEKKYGIVNYFELPEEPIPYDYYSRKVNGVFKPFPKFEISRIAGTVLNADNNHHIVSLLTRYGVVNVKFNRGHYSYYGKQISTKLNPDDKKKTVVEKSWLKRGNLLTIQGIRQGDMFFPKIYKDTIYLHTVNLIQEVREDGTLLLQQERAKV